MFSRTSELSSPEGLTSSGNRGLLVLVGGKAPPDRKADMLFFFRSTISGTTWAHRDDAVTGETLFFSDATGEFLFVASVVAEETGVYVRPVCSAPFVAADMEGALSALGAPPLHLREAVEAA